MPNAIGMESPKAMLPLLPSVVTALPLVLPFPKGKVKLLVDGVPATIDAKLPAAPDKLPAILLNAFPISVPEMPTVPVF
jgi:hypothetical protein